jgi:hypothetical protein
MAGTYASAKGRDILEGEALRVMRVIGLLTIPFP